MEKVVFEKLLNEDVLPLFVGAKIVGEEVSYDRELEVAQGPNGSMLVKPHKQDDYRFVIRRTQPFKSGEIALVKMIINEVLAVYELNLDEAQYIKELVSLAIEKAIANFISETSYKTILGIISELSTWSQKTYEGNKTNFGFVINEATDTGRCDDVDYKNLLSNDFTALLSDGKTSVIELDKDGHLLKHTKFERQRQIPTLCPREYVPLSTYCSDKKIGIVLETSGDMLIFKNHALLFAKRRGVWNGFNHENMITLFSATSNHTAKDIRRALYMTCMDVSFAGGGGCIAYLNKDCVNGVLNHIDISDIITEKHFELKKQLINQEKEMLYNIFNKPDSVADYVEDTHFEYMKKHNCAKSLALKHIIGDKKFHQLSRKLREELVSIDGATIIDEDGMIIAIGAIVKIEAGSISGGRLAATKTLAKYGIAVKVSADGIMQGFATDKKRNHVKPIFSIG